METANNIVPLQHDCCGETVTGKHIDFLAPDFRQICVRDIGWGLSRNARFNGQTTSPDPICVASHSMWVAMYLLNKTNSAKIAMQGLMHDAHEAYTGDITRGVKNIPSLRPGIKALEHRLQSAIWKALRITPPTVEHQALIKEADNQSLVVEAREYMHSRGLEWELPELSKVACTIGKPRTYPHQVAYSQFMGLYFVLSHELSKLN